MKRKDGQKAGDKFAKQGAQRPTTAGALDSRSTNVEREEKIVEMKDTTMENTRIDAATVRGSASEQLFDLAEWEALLDGFDTGTPQVSSARMPSLDAELSSDDLWERLSSTRWVRTPSRAGDNDSTIAQRPSA